MTTHHAVQPPPLLIRPLQLACQSLGALLGALHTQRQRRALLLRQRQRLRQLLLVRLGSCQRILSRLRPPLCARFVLPGAGAQSLQLGGQLPRLALGRQAG